MAKPLNNKQLLDFIFQQMENLSDKKISVQEAQAQANLAKQANNLLKYELDRAKTLMKLTEHNINFQNCIKIRDIEQDNNIDSI